MLMAFIFLGPQGVNICVEVATVKIVLQFMTTTDYQKREGVPLSIEKKPSESRK